MASPISPTKLKQIAAELVARAGGAVASMEKTNIAELQARMVEQIHVQKSLKPPMVILPEGVTWDMIFGNHILRENTGKAEWRKWGEIKAWMMHAMVWWQDALKQGGFSSTDGMKMGSGKNVDDVWYCWKMHAWQFDKKKKGAELADAFDPTYEGKFWRVFYNTAGLSDYPMDCWKDALRWKQEGASDSSTSPNSRGTPTPRAAEGLGGRGERKKSVSRCISASLLRARSAAPLISSYPAPPGPHNGSLKCIDVTGPTRSTFASLHPRPSLICRRILLN